MGYHGHGRPNLGVAQSSKHSRLPIRRPARPLGTARNNIAAAGSSGTGVAWLSFASASEAERRAPKSPRAPAAFFILSPNGTIRRSAEQAELT